MRIAILTVTFPGVSQTFIVNQVTGLLDLGHDVRIYPLLRAGEEQALRDVAEYGLPQRIASVNFAGGRAARLLRAGRAFLRHVGRHPRAMIRALDTRRFGAEALTGKSVLETAFWLEEPYDADVVYCHFGPSGLRGLRLRDQGLLRGKLVTVFHAYDLTRYVRQHGKDVYRPLFERGDLFLPITHYAAEKLSALGCPPSRMRVHPMGVDCRKFAPALARGAALSTGEPKALHLLSVGRLVEKKGFAVALRSLAMLARRGVNVRYVIVGGGPLEAGLKAQAFELSIAERVTFLGAQGSDVVRREMEACDVLVVPSVTARDGDEEGLPVVLMEAMAMGKAVVTTRHAAIPELIEDGRHGLLVDEQDAGGLAEALERLDRDRVLVKLLGDNGQTRVRGEFDVQVLNARLSDVLESVARGPIPAAR